MTLHPWTLNIRRHHWTFPIPKKRNGSSQLDAKRIDTWAYGSFVRDASFIHSFIQTRDGFPLSRN